MTKLFGILFILLSLSLSAFAKHENRPDLKVVAIPALSDAPETINGNSRLSKMLRVIKAFNQRFDTKGRYLDDDRLALNFELIQQQFIDEMKAQKALQVVLLVGNDIDNLLIHGRDHFLRESVLVDENGDFLALVSEKIKYKDSFSRSLPRVFPVFSLLKGQVMISAKDNPALIGKMTQLQRNVMEFELTLAKNILEQIMIKVKIQLSKKADGTWAVIDPENGREIRKLRLQIKIISMNPLSPNGGIANVEFDSRQSLEEMEDPFLN